MNIANLTLSAALLFSATPTLAQTEFEDEQLVFVEVVGRSVQLPLSFAGAVCGLTTEEVAGGFVGGTDPACNLDEAAAARMGLVDPNGEVVDLSRQGFVNVQLPDNESRIQMPRGLAARLCEVDESELADDTSSVRLVGCELSQEQLQVSGLPGLLSAGGENAGGSGG